MPNFFARPCKYPGCRRYAITGSAYCKEHAVQLDRERDSRRLSSHERGYDRRWAKASKAFLKSHPLCAECARQGRTTPATEVDHIVPHKGNKSLFWNSDNWQALCHECHSRKTALEDGGFGRAVTPRGDLKK